MGAQLDLAAGGDCVGGGGGSGDGRGGEGLVGLVGSMHGLGDGPVTGSGVSLFLFDQDDIFDRTERGTSGQQEEKKTAVMPTEMPSLTKHAPVDRKIECQRPESSSPIEANAPDTTALKSSAAAKPPLAHSLEYEFEDDLALDPTVHLAGYESSESLNALSLERSAIRQREASDWKDVSDDEAEASGDEKDISRAGAFQDISPHGSPLSQTGHGEIRWAEDKPTLAGVAAADAAADGSNELCEENWGAGDDGHSRTIDPVPSLGTFADLSPRGPFIYGYHDTQDQSLVEGGEPDGLILDYRHGADGRSFVDADTDSGVGYRDSPSAGDRGGTAAEDEAPPPLLSTPPAFTAASPARPPLRVLPLQPKDEVEEDSQMNDYDEDEEDDDGDYSSDVVVFRPRGASRGPPSGVALPADVFADTETAP